MNLKRLVTIPRRAARYEVLAFWRSRPIRRDTVFYEAFAGSGVLDNPEAIFRELLAAGDLAHLRHVWVVNDPDPEHPARVEFRGDDRVTFVRRGTVEYYRALATSGYLVNNATFPPEFGKRPGQVYLNTWHGTPLKTMGYDMPNGGLEAGNTLRNFVSADFLLSQNSFMTEQMYGRAYKLDGHFRGAIVEEGYPRVDRQSVSARERADVVRRLEARGATIGDRSIVLYAPTWKGTTFNDPSDDVEALGRDVARLQHLVGPEHVVLLKTHQIVERFSRDDPALRSVLVPNDLPTNVVLGLAGSLVTDYSSIFFDFLATGRPIAFYTPDKDDYAANRGTYFGDDDLPGVVSGDLDVIARALVAPGELPDAERHAAVRDAWQKRFASDAIDDSSRRVVDIVFRAKREGYRVLDLSRSERTSILIHLGALWSNGITSSALNLLEAIPSDRFDVSVVFNRTRSEQLRVNQARIAPTVRQFPRDGGMNGSKVLTLRRRLHDRRGRAVAHRESALQEQLWDDEWTRVFGDSTFDHVIDFSGYSPFWATLLLHAPGARTAMWLHNDLVSEVNRVVNGKRRMRFSMPAVFAHYDQYDSLVAVSRSLAEINRRRLVEYTGRPLEVGYARNLLDPARDAERAAVDLLDVPFPVTAADREEGLDRPPVVPAWARELADKGDSIWFVTVGRFSEEKNQARLLRAFARVHAEDARTRLLLIGHGALRSELEAQVDELGLADVAHVVGPLENPLPAVRASDCFVLSSLYEGQPMVLLEAAALDLPIVSVEFESVRDALPAGSIHVVAQEDDALADGMRAFLRGEVPPAHLDEAAYNVEALGEFFRATGIAAPSPAAGESDR
ncbi:CDP-glycerol:poly(glycerophosphate) glycerophosphotransferase [Frondihabitans sp. 762G35]|uniref:glycosyltransferase n=1 Tax=Frondihabitans sp. 762G35 TaxID=1446794 RepID=UPI000D20DB2C|nr:glycosyltransferase [Frondihabitans sp. 762G35]ARC57871.1 CDP-glycerol:poly(glycerophosphate) glycerophosphotransferase [Frondihabitans sp. 762G35]